MDRTARPRPDARRSKVGCRSDRAGATCEAARRGRRGSGRAPTRRRAPRGWGASPERLRRAPGRARKAPAKPRCDPRTRSRSQAIAKLRLVERCLTQRRVVLLDEARRHVAARADLAEQARTTDGVVLT